MQATSRLSHHTDIAVHRPRCGPAQPKPGPRGERVAIAAADEDDDGEVTLEELNATVLDVRLYDPSGLGAATQGAFVTSLARTIGHFRGEGECTISKL